MNMQYLTASIVYSLLGIIVFIVCFVVIERITPENLWREILDKQNLALAVVAAAFMISIALIISSAIHG